jgi:flagellum-specific ATP synthase
MLPRLMERAGRAPQGSITGFYSVLVEGDDPQEPVADTVRGLLDGHTWLSRKLAARGHYPAIDVPESISRLMNDIVPPSQQDAALLIRELLAAYRDHEDLISIGAYRKGANRAVDTAIEVLDDINRFLRQKIEEEVAGAEAASALAQLYQRAQARHAAGGGGAQPGGALQPVATSAKVAS